MFGSIKVWVRHGTSRQLSYLRPLLQLHADRREVRWRAATLLRTMALSLMVLAVLSACSDNADGTSAHERVGPFLGSAGAGAVAAASEALYDGDASFHNGYGHVAKCTSKMRKAKMTKSLQTPEIYGQRATVGTVEVRFGYCTDKDNKVAYIDQTWSVTAIGVAASLEPKGDCHANNAYDVQCEAIVKAHGNVSVIGDVDFSLPLRAGYSGRYRYAHLCVDLDVGGGCTDPVKFNY
jgi:hypothetical protein